MVLNYLFLNVDGIQKKKDDLVILLHGFPETGLTSWFQQIGPLCNEDYHVVVPDLRGYNKSDKPKEIMDYTKNELTKDIVGIIDYYNQSQANIISHDWGAIIGWAIADSFPERVKRLAVLNGPHPFGIRDAVLGGDLMQILRSYYIFYFHVPVLPERVFERNDHSGFDVLFASISNENKTFSKDFIARIKEAHSQPGAITSMINYYRAITKDRVYNQPILDKVVWIIWGKKDKALGFSSAENSVKYVNPNKVQLIPFENAGHFVQHDEPQRVTEILLQFLKTPV